jgi:predicted lipoprotein with Yx(FWY)xxD motif
MNHTAAAARVLLGAGAAVLLAACGTSGYVPANQAAPVGPITAVHTGPVPAGLATGTTQLGTVVTSDGFTLYRFDKDSATPSASTCVGACATTFPPVLGDGVPAVEGLPTDEIGTVGRPDGTQQLNLNGWPLYRFSKDAAPGDVKGDGMGGTWRAIGVDGRPAAAVAAAGPASAAERTPSGG